MENPSATYGMKVNEPPKLSIEAAGGMAVGSGPAPKLESTFMSPDNLPGGAAGVEPIVKVITAVPEAAPAANASAQEKKQTFSERVAVEKQAALVRIEEKNKIRAEKEAKTKEKWDKFWSGVKSTVDNAKNLCRKGKEQMRLAMEMAPGVVGVTTLSAQEKAVEAYNLGEEIAGKINRGTEVAGQKVGEVVVGTGKVLGKGLEFAGALGVVLVVESYKGGDRLVKGIIEDSRENVKDAYKWAKETGNWISESAEKARKGAVESFGKNISKISKFFGDARKSVRESYNKFDDKMDAAYNKFAQSCKDEIASDIEDVVSDWHKLLSAGARAVENAAVNRAAALEKQAKDAAEVAAKAKEFRIKQNSLRHTQTDVSAWMALNTATYE